MGGRSVELRVARARPHFEQPARTHVRRIGETLTGIPIVTVGTTVGTTVGNEMDDRVAHELDIVALGPGTGPKHRVIAAIGEAMLQGLDAGVLSRLERIRTVLHVAEQAHIVLVSASGFAHDVGAESDSRLDVHLVDLEDIQSS